MPVTQAVLTLSCPNRPGIVAAVSTYLFEQGCNILEAHQYDDTETGKFFMRIVFSQVNEVCLFPNIREGFHRLAETYRMSWTMRPRGERRKVMLLVSRFDHCLADLLYRWRIGEVPMDITAIVSNYPRETYANHRLRRDSVPLPADHQGDQAAAGGSDLVPGAGNRHGDCRARAVHAGPVGRSVAQAGRATASTSTIPSCPASKAPSPIIRRMRAASS